MFISKQEENNNSKRSHLESPYFSIFTACSLREEKDRGPLLDKIYAALKTFLYAESQQNLKTVVLDVDYSYTKGIDRK